MVGNGFTYSLSSDTTSVSDTVWPIWNETRANFNLGDEAWRIWNEATSATAISLRDTTYRDGVWFSWLDNGTATASPTTTLANFVWTEWIDENGRRIRPAVQQPQPPVQYAPPPPPNPFTVLKKKLIRRRVVRTAKKKGRALLRSICSDEQWKDYLRYGSVREIGERAIYEVGAGWSGHIYEIDFKDEPLRKLCVHMAIGQAGKHWIDEDRIAAVLLALRHDEAVTVAKACTHHFSEEQKRRVKARRGHKRKVA